MRQATLDDVERLVELMTEFYAESAFTLNRSRAAATFARLLADDRLGRVWIIDTEGEDAGYLAVTFGFSLEYGGLDGVVDDFFVRSEFRGKGIGTSALIEARDICAALGVRAMHLEVGADNVPAQAVYRRVGFAETGRQLLTLRLAQPAHEE